MEQQVVSMSLLEMAAKGGWLMIVLLLLSILAIYIFGKKLWMIRKAGKVDRYFMSDIMDYLNDGKIEAAKGLCAKYDSPIARMAERGIAMRNRTASEVQTAMENVGNVEVATLEKGLSTLASIAGGAPMIGFLGTVTGMVKAFFEMANNGSNVDITLLSGGIYEAMITTVGGLIVGIIAYFGYNYLVGQVNSLTARMDGTTMDMLEILDSAKGFEK